MAQLLVRNVPDEVAKSLKRRAAERGVSAEEEHRQILSDAFKEAPVAATEASEKPRNLFEAIFELGRIAPDFEFGNNRREWKRREVEL
jgi:plasmid stability protein